MKKETFLFEAAEPWAEAVPVAGLLGEIEATIRKHVILSEQAAAALAVWVLHTYTFELRDAVAYVAIESPEKRCGKTTLLSVLAAMAHKPLIASNITVSALFRAIDACRPTLFIDEADTFLAGNGAMRGMLNAGNTWRTAYVLRFSKAKGVKAEVEKAESGNPTGNGGNGNTEHRTSNAEHRIEGGKVDSLKALNRYNGETGLRRYSCWCPKVIALIGEAPDTIGDRSIVVKMSRKLVSEACAPLAELDTRVIRSKCARFALDAGSVIAAAAKIRGRGLNDRAADTFEPLYVIARLAGEEWERKLDAAARALTAPAHTDNARADLLLDILTVFVESGRQRMFTRMLAATLREGPLGMRSTALKISEMTEHGIAKALRPYGIKPTTLRIGTEVNKGYVDVDFREALRRYVPKADIDERIRETQRRSALLAEAEALKAEIEKAEGGNGGELNRRLTQMVSDEMGLKTGPSEEE